MSEHNAPLARSSVPRWRRTSGGSSVVGCTPGWPPLRRPQARSCCSRTSWTKASERHCTPIRRTSRCTSSTERSSSTSTAQEHTLSAGGLVIAPRAIPHAFLVLSETRNHPHPAHPRHLRGVLPRRERTAHLRDRIGSSTSTESGRPLTPTEASRSLGPHLSRPPELAKCPRHRGPNSQLGHQESPYAARGRRRLERLRSRPERRRRP